MEPRRLQFNDVIQAFKSVFMLVNIRFFNFALFLAASWGVKLLLSSSMPLSFLFAIYSFVWPIAFGVFISLQDSENANFGHFIQSTTKLIDASFIYKMTASCILSILLFVFFSNLSHKLDPLLSIDSKVVYYSSVGALFLIYNFFHMMETKILQQNFNIARDEAEWAWKDAISINGSLLISVIATPFYIFYLFSFVSNVSYILFYVSVIFYYFCIKAIFCDSAKVNEKLFEKQSAQQTALSQ